MRETAFDNTFLKECTPSYFNGENSEQPHSYAGEPYGPGWDAYESVLQAWRDTDGFDGMIVTTAEPAAKTAAPAE